MVIPPKDSDRRGSLNSGTEFVPISLDMRNETGRLFGFLSFIFTIIMLGANSASALGIRGKITDLTDTPIIGATVMVWQADQMIVGGATDNDGHYLIATNLTDSDSVTISVRAIGYESLRSQVIELSTNSEHSYSLKPRSVEIGSVIVRPSRDFDSRSLSLSGEDIVRASQSSLSHLWYRPIRLPLCINLS